MICIFDPPILWHGNRITVIKQNAFAQSSEARLEKKDKIDFKKKLKHLYHPSLKEVGLVDVPPMNYLMVDGKGDPNKVVEFQDAIAALFGLAYALKFMIKKGPDAIDYGVLPLEGLWWSDDKEAFNRDQKDKWLWSLMIMQPDYVTGELYAGALEFLKKKQDLPALELIRFDSYFEGLSAQIMHLGHFSEEGPTIAKLHQYIAINQYRFNGKHHEIYLSDIRRAAPEKWRTVLRQPIKKGE